MKHVVAIMVAVLVLVSVSYASNVSKAKDFIKAGMYPQAIELLDKEIHDNPTNAEAHFELGSCYVTQGRYGDADARFASAVRLNSVYGYKIGGIYKNAGLSAAEKGQLDTAATLLNKAITYQPDLKAGLASTMFEKGKATNIGAYFDMAYQLDSKIGVKIGEHFSTLSQSKVNENDKMDALANAAKYDPKYGEQYRAYKDNLGRKYLEQAKEFAKKQGKESDVDKFKALARKYLGEAVVEKELPNVVKYQSSKDRYRFPLVAGEQVNHWIKPAGFSTSFSSDEECQYDVLYEDGYVAKKGETRDMDMAKNFKFRAYSICTQYGGIGLLVK